MRINISPARGEIEVSEAHRIELDLVRRQAAAGSGQVRRLVAQAVVALRQDSARHFVDRRRYFQLPAGAWTLDVAARTPFVRAGCACAAEADGADARMG